MGKFSALGTKILKLAFFDLSRVYEYPLYAEHCIGW